MKRIKALQNLLVGLWLLKDASWCQEWVKVGTIVAVPTLALAIKIAWDHRHDAVDLVHSIAVCLWLSANVVWMIGEFFLEPPDMEDVTQDPMRQIAKYFFFAGLALLAGFYLIRAAWAVRRRAQGV